MAAGSSRIARYILFAFFGIMILYFMSSTIPRRPLSAEDLKNLGKGEKTSPSIAPEYQGSSQETLNEPDASEKGPLSTLPTPVSAAKDVSESTSAPTSPKPKQGLSTKISPDERLNATFVTLARNSDLWDIVKSIRQVEDRFNRNYGYDWVFLNDKPFDETFKKVTSALISGKTHYGEIPHEHWSYPPHIDQDKARKVREDMAQRQIIYGDSESYRHMCRFESGFFFRQELMNKYEWYWRVEPSIELYCDISYDPFKFMRDNKKKYSFVISLYEYVETIPTIWDSVKSFMKNHPEHIAEGNAMKWVSDDGGDTYNHCHFWSNFEIGNLNWLRSKSYIDYFTQLDQDGGFFYERWGDAPVHSIAAALTLKKEEIHFFDDIAYWHVPFTHCPTEEQKRLDNKCHCNPKENFDWKGYSCTSKWFDVNNMEKPEGYEKQSG